MSSSDSAPRGRPPSSRGGLAPRSRITAAAGQLMRRRGYYATGLNDVLSASKAPKGSLYHYFPGGKEQLASESISRSAEFVTERIEAAFAASEDVGAVLRAFADVLARNLSRSDFRDGCPVATVTLDASSESQAIQASCAATFTSWRDAIAAQLQCRGHQPAEALELAVLLLSAFEGALVMARALRDVQPLYDVAGCLTRRLGL